MGGPTDGVRGTRGRWSLEPGDKTEDAPRDGPYGQERDDLRRESRSSEGFEGRRHPIPFPQVILPVTQVVRESLRL